MILYIIKLKKKIQFYHGKDELKIQNIGAYDQFLIAKNHWHEKLKNLQLKIDRERNKMFIQANKLEMDYNKKKNKKNADHDAKPLKQVSKLRLKAYKHGSLRTLHGSKWIGTTTWFISFRFYR